MVACLIFPTTVILHQPITAFEVFADDESINDSDSMNSILIITLFTLPILWSLIKAQMLV